VTKFDSSPADDVTLLIEYGVLVAKYHRRLFDHLKVSIIDSLPLLGGVGFVVHVSAHKAEHLFIPDVRRLLSSTSTHFQATVRIRMTKDSTVFTQGYVLSTHRADASKRLPR
jgi:hypothetical protein